MNEIKTSFIRYIVALYHVKHLDNLVDIENSINSYFPIVKEVEASMLSERIKHKMFKRLDKLQDAAILRKRKLIKK
jgi:hypothetical protein